MTRFRKLWACPKEKSSPEHTFGSSPWAFRVWLLCIWLLSLLGVFLSTAWGVKHAQIQGPRLSENQGRFILALADFPSQAKSAWQELVFALGGEPAPLLLNRQSVTKPSWTSRFPAPEDLGYLLLSGMDAEVKHSTVQLIRIADGARIARWNPDWTAIYQKISDKRWAPKGSRLTARAVHPVLLADGDIVFNTSHAMVRLSLCSRQPVWVLDEVMHHSNRQAADGTIWTPSVSEDGFADNPWLRSRIRDDALARVSTDGRILEKISFTRILSDNGLLPLMLGTSGNYFLDDPIHLNQITEARQDTRHWLKGDLLISSRHMSTVFLYRPATGRIIWYRTGPWMNQHAADFIDDHRISVFDNNVISGLYDENAFVSPNDNNRVIVYDFETQQYSEPYAALLAKSRPITRTEGRARVLPDGGLFVEESNNGRLLRFTPDKLLWSKINDYDAQRIGILSWSRYMTAEDIKDALPALIKRKCGSF